MTTVAHTYRHLQITSTTKVCICVAYIGNVEKQLQLNNKQTIFVYYYINSIDKYVKRLTNYWTEKQSPTWRYGFNTTLTFFSLLLLPLHFISLTDNISKYCRPWVQVFSSLASHSYYSSLSCRFPDSICTLSRVGSLMLSDILLYGGGVFFLASLWFVLGVGYRL